MTERQGPLSKIVGWFDSRLGLTHPLLRPVPQYALNPFYWLGALAVVAFVIQGVTGMIMMLYYVPSPAEAYSSTQYIFQSVSNGRFLETVHLYTAYAMIMLAFMHMMRGYLVSVHKKPREVMWLVGMLMGFITLGFGFTGYLLPGSVVSVEATNVGVAMVDNLPKPLSSWLTFLIVGGGGDADKLLRFFDLHVVVLPAALLILLVVKMYMLEAHGVAEPTSGAPPPSVSKTLPIFPDVTLYLVELSLLFGAAMLLVSAIFPVTLPPVFSSVNAGQYQTPQPDWYFLWIYQVLKLSIFEDIKINGMAIGTPLALSLITLVFLALVALPFIDRGRTRAISRRPVYATLGVLFAGEVAALSYWGMISPGETIHNEQAAMVLGGVALLITLGSLVSYRLLYSKAKSKLPTAPASMISKSELWAGIAFTVLVGAGALTIGATLNSLVGILAGGFSWTGLLNLSLSLFGLAASAIGSTLLIYRLDLRAGTLKKRVGFIERMWAHE